MNFLYPTGAIAEIAALTRDENDEEIMCSGYFPNDAKGHNKVIQEISRLEAIGIYASLNPCIPDVVKDRSNNRIKRAYKRTKDTEISSLRNILIDIDPVRDSGSSATEQEHDAAIRLAKKIRNELNALGFPPSLLVDSGNGAHIIIKSKLKNTEQNSLLIRAFLRELARRYDTDTVKIDTSVSNPSRLVKLPGTITRKGKNTTKRPHRLAKILKIPKETKTVSVETIKQFVPSIENMPANSTHSSTAPYTFLDVPAYLKHYGVPLVNEKRHRDGRIYTLKRCPFNPKHGLKKAAIFQAANGTLYFRCFHDSCCDMRWADVRRKISGADHLERFNKTAHFNSRKNGRITNYSFMNGEMLIRKKMKENPVIRNLLEKGGCLLIVGPTGIGKSMLTLNIALNLGSMPANGRLWDTFEIPKNLKTLIIQSENNSFYTKARLKLMMDGNPDYQKAMKRVIFPDIHDNCRVTGDLRDPEFKDMIVDLMFKTGARLLIIDPFISFLHVNENENVAVHNVLESLREICDITRSACILIHHEGKKSSDDVNSARGASSIPAWASYALNLKSVDKDGKKLIEVNQTKTRNSKPVSKFTLQLTGKLDFVRVHYKEEEKLDIVVKVLNDLGGKVENQKKFIDAIVKEKECSPSSARRLIEAAVQREDIKELKGGKEVGYEVALALS